MSQENETKIDRLMALVSVPKRYSNIARETFSKLSAHELDARLQQREADEKYLAEWRKNRGTPESNQSSEPS